MMIRKITVLAVWLITTSVSAQLSLNNGDCKDSLFVQMSSEDTCYLIWRTGASTTLNTVLGTVAVSVEEVTSVNPILHFREVRPCDYLLVPFRPELLHFSNISNGIPVWLNVMPGQTLFGIAHRILHVSIDTLLFMNPMEIPQVREGQQLLIGWLPRTDRTPDALDDALAAGDRWYYFPDEQQQDIPDLSGKHLAEQRGVALWNKDKPDSNLFALHRFAPINSYIEIINPMFHRSVLAKVIGSIPPTYPEDIAVIVSQGVAQELGAIDSRFYVELQYETR